MKRRHRNKKRPVRLLRLWTHDEAAKAIPYLRSVVGSLREHWLTVQSLERDIALLQRGTRKAVAHLVAEKTAEESCDRAEAQFQDALAELSQLDVFLLDPLQGLALIPFRKEDDLAWFVYDHFSTPGLAGWRLHEDPLEKCRPLKNLDGPIATDSVPN
jgi:hypothetical protein